MSREDWVALGTRLFVLYSLMQLLIALPGLLEHFEFFKSTQSKLLLLPAVLLVAGLLALLWFFPLSIARKLLPAMSEPRSDTAMNASITFSVALVLMGLWFLAGAVLDATQWLIRYFAITRNPTPLDFAWRPHQIADIVVIGVQSLLGITLILGSSGIKRLIFKLRYGSEWERRIDTKPPH